MRSVRHPTSRVRHVKRTVAAIAARPSLFRALSTRCFKRLVVDDRGATAIEYSLVAAGVALAVIATVMSLGSTVKSTFYDRLIAMM